jgi:hypothetical protein
MAFGIASVFSSSLRRSVHQCIGLVGTANVECIAIEPLYTATVLIEVPKPRMARLPLSPRLAIRSL